MKLSSQYYEVDNFTFGLGEQASCISEGVMEIRINSQPCKGINLATRHKQARRAPRVATVRDMIKESARVLPRPSAIFHTYASADTLWVGHYYPF
jgi:hypothetical protein